MCVDRGYEIIIGINTYNPNGLISPAYVLSSEIGHLQFLVILVIFKSVLPTLIFTHTLSLSHAHTETVAQTTQSNTTSVSTTGFSVAGDCQFPPNNGMTYSTWFSMCNI